MILRAVIIWALAASALAALSYWQWGLAADRADAAEARVEALVKRLSDIQRDAERDREIDNVPLGPLPDEYRRPE